MSDDRRLVIHASQRLVLEGLCWVCEREAALDVVGATKSSDRLSVLC